MILESKRANYFTDLAALRRWEVPQKLLERRGGRQWVAIPHHRVVDAVFERFVAANTPLRNVRYWLSADKAQMVMSMQVDDPTFPKIPAGVNSHPPASPTLVVQTDLRGKTRTVFYGGYQAWVAGLSVVCDKWDASKATHKFDLNREANSAVQRFLSRIDGYAALMMNFRKAPVRKGIVNDVLMQAGSLRTVRWNVVAKTLDYYRMQGGYRGSVLQFYQLVANQIAKYSPYRQCNKMYELQRLIRELFPGINGDRQDENGFGIISED